MVETKVVKTGPTQVGSFRRRDGASGDKLPAEFAGANHASMGMWRDSLRRMPPIGFFLVEIRGAGSCKVAPAGFMFASVGVPTQGYGHDGPGVCLGDGLMEAYLKDMDMAGLASA